ncbi:MAG: RNA polymerase sigma factor [Gaiellaceae bacterium]
MRFARQRGARLEEIAAIYRERFDEFQRLAASVSGAPDDAWDVVQDAFAKAVATRCRYRGEGPLEAWLWRAVVRSALNHRRASERAPLTLAFEVADSLAGELAVSDPDIRRALERLSDRQRAAVFLRYYADLDYASIGTVLGIRRGTVSALLHAAHRNLRRSVAEARV